MSPPAHLLLEHVYVCVANHHLVFLDLRRDKYLCLDQATSRLLSPFIRADGRDPGSARVEDSSSS